MGKRLAFRREVKTREHAQKYDPISSTSCNGQRAVANSRKEREGKGRRRCREKATLEITPKAHTSGMKRRDHAGKGGGVLHTAKKKGACDWSPRSGGIVGAPRNTSSIKSVGGSAEESKGGGVEKNGITRRRGNSTGRGDHRQKSPVHRLAKPLLSRCVDVEEPEKSPAREEKG